MKALGYNVLGVQVHRAGHERRRSAGWRGCSSPTTARSSIPTTSGFDYSWIPMLVVILGGAGTKLGPIVGRGDRGVVGVLHQPAHRRSAGR